MVEKKVDKTDDLMVLRKVDLMAQRIIGKMVVRKAEKKKVDETV